MKIEIEFKKDVETDKWYTVIPEYTGNKADLEMIAGVDTLLDIINLNCNFNGVVVLELFIEEEFIKQDKLGFNGKLKLINISEEINGGAFYKGKYTGVRLHEIWLQNLTKFIFGYMPEDIGFLVI